MRPCAAWRRSVRLPHAAVFAAEQSVVAAGQDDRRRPEALGRGNTRAAGFLTADNPVSSTLTRQLLDWEPAHPGLIDDLDKGRYFHSRSA